MPIPLEGLFVCIFYRGWHQIEWMKCLNSWMSGKKQNPEVQASHKWKLSWCSSRIVCWVFFEGSWLIDSLLLKGTNFDEFPPNHYIFHYLKRNVKTLWISENIYQWQEVSIKGFFPPHSDFTVSAVSIWPCNFFLTFRFIECQWLVVKQKNLQMPRKCSADVGNAVLRLTTK